MKTGNIVITEYDHEHLLRLINSKRQSGHEIETLDALEQELEGASIVNESELPDNVVTMNSQVRVKDLDRNDEVAYQIVFPADANARKNRISVLAPIGTGLLGYRAGDVVEWPVPSGIRRLRIVAVRREPIAPAHRTSMPWRREWPRRQRAGPLQSEKLQ